MPVRLALALMLASGAATSAEKLDLHQRKAELLAPQALAVQGARRLQVHESGHDEHEPCENTVAVVPPPQRQPGRGLDPALGGHPAHEASTTPIATATTMSPASHRYPRPTATQASARPRSRPPDRAI